MSDRGFNCPKWYDIPGIEFIYTMPRDSDNHILFEGVEDDSNIIVEDTMWDMFNEEFPDHDAKNFGTYEDQFEAYMIDNEEEVKGLIRMTRGQIEYY